MEAYKISDSQFAVCGDSDLFFEDYECIAKDMIDSFKRRSIEVDKNDDERICVEVRCTIGFCIEKKDTLNKALVALNEASIAFCIREEFSTLDLYLYISFIFSK